MLKTSSTLPAKKKVGTNKLVMGFAAVAATAVISATGVAAAANNGKPSQDECKTAGFKNYGQCVKEWAHNKNKPGGGYGGTTINVGVDVNGNNNVIHVIINFFR